MTEDKMPEGERRYRSLFENSPTSIWDEDFSEVRLYLDRLRSSGVEDFRTYFDSHIESVADCIALVKIIEVNEATLQLYQAESKEDIMAGLGKVFTEESVPVFKEQLIAIAEGKLTCESEAITRTLTGRKNHVIVKWSVVPGCETTWSRVLVSIIDITQRRQADEAVRKHNRELLALNRIGRTVTNSMRIQDILEAAIDSVLETLDVSVGAIGILESAGKSKCFASRGLSKEIVQYISPVNLQRGAGFAGKVLQENRIVVVDSLADQTEESFRLIVEKLGLRSAVGVPLKSENRALGVMVLTSQGQRVFSEEEIQLLETIGNHLGTIIENAQLFERVIEQSVTDELTGLNNRRHFYNVLETEINRSVRFGWIFSIVMLDLDGFKKHNDTLGHTNGDAALTSFARVLKSVLRKTDIAFRYGGDEFAIILPQTEAGRTRRIMERIRTKWLQAPKAEYSVLENPLGFSAGIAQFPENAETGDSLVFLADTALYHAKRQGGHRTVLASELPAT